MVVPATGFGRQNAAIGSAMVGVNPVLPSSVRRPSNVTPTMHGWVRAHEGIIFRGGVFTVRGQGLNDWTCIFLLRPRSGGSDVTLSALNGVYCDTYVDLVVPDTCPTGVTYDLVMRSWAGEQVLKGNFHQRTWNMAGLTCSALTATLTDFWGVGEYWGLSEGGANCPSPLNIVRLTDGMVSTDGGVTWPTGPVAGYESGNKIKPQDAAMVSTSWTVTLTSGSGQLKITYKGNTWTGTTGPLTSTSTQAQVLAELKSMVDANGHILFADKNDVKRGHATTAQITVSGTGPFTVTCAGDFVGMDFQASGTAINLAFTGTLAGSVTRATTGSFTDWTTALKACTDYVINTWSATVGGSVWIPPQNGKPTYYYVDGPGSHAVFGTANVSGSTTHAMRFTQAAGFQRVGFIGGGTDKTILQWANQVDDRDTVHQAANRQCFAYPAVANGARGLFFANLSLECMAESTNSYCMILALNSSATFRNIHTRAVRFGGPGWFTWNLNTTDLATTYSHSFVDTDWAVVNGFRTYYDMEYPSTGVTQSSLLFTTYDFLNIDNCSFHRTLGRVYVKQTNSISIRRTRNRLVNWTSHFYAPLSAGGNFQTLELGAYDLSWCTNLLYAESEHSKEGFQTVTNQCEGLLTQYGGTSSTIYGPRAVTSGGAQNVVLAASWYAGAATPAGAGQNSAFRGATDWMYAVTILKGTGKGQTRYVTGVSTTTNTNDTIAVHAPWTTPPDNTSLVLLHMPVQYSHTWSNFVSRGFLYESSYNGAIQSTVTDARVDNGGTIEVRTAARSAAPGWNPIIDVRIARNLFTSRGKWRTGVNVLYVFDAPGTLVNSDVTATDGGLVQNVVLQGNVIRSDAADLYSNYSSNFNRCDGYHKSLGVTGAFATLTIANIEGSSPGFYDLGDNKWNGATVAFQTTFEVTSEATKPHAAYGQQRASRPTIANVGDTPSTTCDPNGEVTPSNGAATPTSYPTPPPL